MLRGGLDLGRGRGARPRTRRTCNACILFAWLTLFPTGCGARTPLGSSFDDASRPSAVDQRQPAVDASNPIDRTGADSRLGEHDFPRPPPDIAEPTLDFPAAADSLSIQDRHPPPPSTTFGTQM